MRETQKPMSSKRDYSWDLCVVLQKRTQSPTWCHCQSCKMRKRAREELTTIRQIYNEALQCGNKESVQQTCPLYLPWSQTSTENKEKQLPPMQQTRAEVTLAVIGPIHLEVILAEEGADDEIILLGTQSNLPHLAEADCLYMDGTFQTCPCFYYQIFIIKYGQTFPMVYALLPNKQQAISNRMFMMMKEATLNLGLKLTCSSVVSGLSRHW